MILHETRDKSEHGRPKPTKLYSESGMAKLVRRLRAEAGLPTTFTLDACRHGGMTELEEAELRAVRDARSRHTRAGPMRGTPSERWNGHSRRPGSGMHTGSRACRTRREQNFGMKRGKNFGMKKVDRAVRRNNASSSML